MNSESSLSPDVARLARAVRFAFVCLVLVLSYLGIRATLAIPHFARIFADMLNGKSLPASTEFVIRARLALLVFSCCIPLAAIGTLFTRRLIASFYVLGGLCLAAFVLFLFMYQALSEPLYSIISAMEGS